MGHPHEASVPHLEAAVRGPAKARRKLELPWPFPLPPHGAEETAVRVEVAEFLAAGVQDHDPPVLQPDRPTNPMELVGLLPFPHADLEERSLGEGPDFNGCFLSGLRCAGALIPGLVFTASGKREEEESTTQKKEVRSLPRGEDHDVHP